jgi:hypothetical protein
VRHPHVALFAEMLSLPKDTRPALPQPFGLLPPPEEGGQAPRVKRLEAGILFAGMGWFVESVA